MPDKTPQEIAAGLAAEDEDLTEEEREAVEKALSPDKEEPDGEEEEDEGEEFEEGKADKDVEVEGKKPDPEPSPDDGKKPIPPEYQPEIDRIVRERLSRDRKSQTVQRIEAMFGRPLEEVIPLVEQQQKHEFESKVKDYADTNGLTEELARELLTQKQEIDRIRFESTQSQRKALVSQQKESLRSEPFFKELEQEVDDLVAGDSALEWSTAFLYLRGKKLPEFLKQRETATEQRVLTDVQKRAGKKVSGNSTPGKDSSTLSPRQKQLARIFGVPEAELAKRVKGGK